MEARRVLALGLLVIAFGLTTAVRRSSAQPPPVDDYLALLDRYRSVDTRGAVQAMSDREDRWVESAVGAALRNAALWPTERIEAAVLLHTEVVTGGWVLAQHVPVHLTAARRLMELGRPHRVPDDFRRRWLLAVCWHFQSEMELGALVPWLDELRTLAPDDPERLLAEGIFYETLAWNDAPPADLTWDGRSPTLSAVSSRKRTDILERASAAYRRAAGSAGVHDAASARLGRTLAELGRTEEARRTLTPLTTSAGERRWRYLAALFLAQAEAGAGRRVSAAAAYERAATLLPGCQTPHVGLTVLRRLEGEIARAAEIAAALTRATLDCDDPWWFYRFGQPPDRLPQLLAALREPLLH